MSAIKNFFEGCSESAKDGLDLLFKSFKKIFLGTATISGGLGFMAGYLATIATDPTNGVLKGLELGAMVSFGIAATFSTGSVIAASILDKKAPISKKIGRAIAYPILALGLTIGVAKIHTEFNNAVKINPYIKQRSISCQTDFNTNKNSVKESSLILKDNKLTLS